MSYIRSNESVVVSKMRCPACEKAGRDKHADNLAVYSDGHKHCFACGYRVRSPNSLSNLRSRLERNTSDEVPKSNSRLFRLVDGFDIRSVPQQETGIGRQASEWLLKYSVTPRESLLRGCIHLGDEQLLCFPVHKHGSLRYVNCRYLGTDGKYPKYVGLGSKPITPVYLNSMEDEAPRVVVLCEDFVSGIKIARQFTSTPLFGTSLHNSWLLHLAKRPDTIVRVWLDRDKAEHAIRMAARLSQYLPDCATIITERDPKCYSDEVIHELVVGTFKSLPQSRALQ
jgi:hypothetical protein